MIVHRSLKKFAPCVCSMLALMAIFTCASLAWADEATKETSIEHQTLSENEKSFPHFPFLSCVKVPQKEVIATVNGTAITLSELLIAHGTNTFPSNLGIPLDIEELRQEYSLILKELIIQSLVKEHLASLNLSITEEDVRKAELVFRADYDSVLKHEQNTFETSLLEEGISLDAWRVLLGNRLAMERFNKQVLGQNIVLSKKEIQEYHQEHSASFALEERMRFILIKTQNRDNAQKIIEALQGLAILHEYEFHNSDTISQKLSHLSDYTIEKMLLPTKHIVPEWLRELEKTDQNIHFFQPEEGLHAHYKQDDYIILVKQAVLPQKELSLSEAYVRIERALMAQKINTAFTTWLSEKLVSAKIRVIPQLSPLSL